LTKDNFICEGGFTMLFSKKDPNSLYGLALLGLLLTTIYTAILATQLMSTKQKVDYLFFKTKFDEQE
jgi:hypothetical protein